MADHRRSLGVAGEDAVAAWYSNAGYALLDRNWRCREGELDLVLARGRAVVFCEVKTRRSTRFGEPVEAVVATKARRLRRLAALWLAASELHPAAVRFDVVSVLPQRAGAARVEHLRGAF